MQWMPLHRTRRPVATEDGFTIIELVVSLAILAMVLGPLAGVFWSAMRTAGVSGHRTDGASIASREIESMRAFPYAQVGFYADEPGYVSSFEGFTTVSLGATSPSSGSLVPKVEPQTPDPNAAAGYAPDPNPTNASAVVLSGETFSMLRYVVWVNAQDTSTTYAQAYKRLTVIVSWSDQAGSHTVRQDSLLYPGGLGAYQGPMGGSSTTTTTAAPTNPSQPVLNTIVALAAPAGETQVPLTWTQPAGGAAVTSYSIEYSTSPSFPPGNFSVVSGFEKAKLNDWHGSYWCGQPSSIPIGAFAR